MRKVKFGNLRERIALYAFQGGQGGTDPSVILPVELRLGSLAAVRLARAVAGKYPQLANDLRKAARIGRQHELACDPGCLIDKDRMESRTAPLR